VRVVPTGGYTVGFPHLNARDYQPLLETRWALPETGYLDITQGGSGTCTTIAAIAACTRVNPGFAWVPFRRFDPLTRRWHVCFGSFAGYGDVECSLSVAASIAPGHARVSDGSAWVPMLEKAMIQLLGVIRSAKQSTMPPDDGGRRIGPRTLSCFPFQNNSDDVILPLRLLSGGSTTWLENPTVADIRDVFTTEPPCPVVAWSKDTWDRGSQTGNFGHMVCVAGLSADNVLHFRDQSNPAGVQSSAPFADFVKRYPFFGWARNCHWQR
jgi:hypothetical protein